MVEIIHKELGFKVLGMAYTIHNILGPGLLEHAYEEAFCIELRRAGIPFERQKVFALFYKGEPIGGYIADLATAMDGLVSRDAHDVRSSRDGRRQDRAGIKVSKRAFVSHGGADY